VTISDDVLKRLAPPDADGWVADWGDVVRRAREDRGAPRVWRRRGLLAVALAVVVLIPLAATAATRDWWFLDISGAPTPAAAPIVVREGEWYRHPWELVAFPSTSEGLCFGINPRGEGETGGGLACAAVVGVARTPETKDSPDLAITYMHSGGDNGGLPAYIVGPVIESAATVVIRFQNGQQLRVPTFPAPAPLDRLRFYATPLPPDLAAGSAEVEWLAGLDSNDRVVACLAPSTARHGSSALTDCQ
jgi:hypothetical protein